MKSLSQMSVAELEACRMDLLREEVGICDESDTTDGTPVGTLAQRLDSLQRRRREVLNELHLRTQAGMDTHVAIS